MGGDFFNPYVPDFDMFAYIESRAKGRWKESSTTLFINLIIQMEQKRKCKTHSTNFI
jgi:hypothetical protein